MNDLAPCPCHSGKSYLFCCAPFHKGVPAPTALQLMRSRYAAYALGKADYIIETTHPRHQEASLPPDVRRKKILQFCSSTRFEGLKVESFSEEGNRATVTFVAFLLTKGKKGKIDSSFREVSLFEKVEGIWKYLTADVR